MNANTPLEASNLNNPCPLIRAKIGEYQTDPTLKEHIWPHNLSDPIIKALREASSQRMMNNNASPTDSYDFLDTNFARENLHYDVAKINLDCLHALRNLNKAIPDLHTRLKLFFHHNTKTTAPLGLRRNAQLPSHYHRSS